MSKDPSGSKAHKRDREADDANADAAAAAASKHEKKRLKKEVKRAKQQEQEGSSSEPTNGAELTAVASKDAKEKEKKKHKKADREEKDKRESAEKDKKREAAKGTEKKKRKEEKKKKKTKEKEDKSGEKEKMEEKHKKRKRDDATAAAEATPASEEVGTGSAFITTATDDTLRKKATKSPSKTAKKHKENLTDDHDGITAEEEAMMLNGSHDASPSKASSGSTHEDRVASSEKDKKDQEDRGDKKERKEKEKKKERKRDKAEKSDTEDKEAKKNKQSKGAAAGAAEPEQGGEPARKGKKTDGRVAKPKAPTAKELYQNRTWKPPREAKVKTQAELERVNKQRRALAAWGKRHSKRHILVERCFSRMQLGWLTDDIGLEFKRGIFTKQEHDTLKRTIEVYKKRNNMSHDVLLDMIFNAKKAKMQREHQLFFQECAGSLVDRANTSVRSHIKTFLHPYWRKGYWTFAELQELKSAFEEVGHDFVAIGERVGRLSQNARSKWYYLEDVRYRANLGPWTVEEKQKLREAVIHFRKQRPCTHLIWSEIAKEVGGNRHPRNYAAMWHCMRGKRMAVRQQDMRQRELEREGMTYEEALRQTQKEWRETGSFTDFVSDVIDDAELDQEWPLQEEWIANGFRGEPGMEVDGWEPRVDDLILLQRLRYQCAARKEQVNWEGLGFGQWNWPGDILKQKLEEIVEKRCPPYFRNKRSWPAILDKVYWDMEKDNFNPGYDPYHEDEAEAEEKAKGAAADDAVVDDELVDDVPSDLEEYMDDDE